MATDSKKLPENQIQVQSAPMNEPESTQTVFADLGMSEKGPPSQPIEGWTDVDYALGPLHGFLEVLKCDECDDELQHVQVRWEIACSICQIPAHDWVHLCQRCSMFCCGECARGIQLDYCFPPA